ncbi:MAG: RNA-binding protein [Bacteroidota bacterium]|jgi:RNA recognition motif-containing protein
MNIYVANLNYSVSSEQLQQLFEGYGEVTSAKVILDRETGRSRGFGFVEMTNDSEAIEAIEKINQTEHVGKVLNVTEARPKAEGSGGGGRSGFGNRSNNDRGPRRY